MQAPRLKPYIPTAGEPIKLGGQGAGSTPSIPKMSSHTAAPSSQQPSVRPQLRAVTELPPPSQLDIDWSPVLTRNNERILKLGNLIVTSAPAPTSPTGRDGGNGAETPRKFSRFFGGATTKKKERLVMITSTARIMVAAAGGNEKKAKLEVSLLGQGTSYRSFQDSKGLTAFSVESRDKLYTFEDPRATIADPEGSRYSTQEWMECIERSKELAMVHSMASYSGESVFNDLGSNMSSPASTAATDTTEHSGHHRQTLKKEPGDGDSVKSRKNRFSKRQSKSGLAAVF